jgi:hypothetical protein
MIMRRSHSATETQVYLFLKDDSKEVSQKPQLSGKRSFGPKGSITRDGRRTGFLKA